ncbi:MAG TPA: TonB-dependent receptor plug domain-containing protein [Caulobacter sp.]|nr:TonB-dependent receptor plug domain-containing protein [Caulobacter sp.]
MLDDIVVTARRREERLQEVPVAVTALSEEVLEEKGVRDANDLGQVAPGLSVQNTTANRNNITYSIRGQGQAFGQNSPGVVPYFAEVPSFGDAIFDLQGIQVLKGPQGTLFGRNTTGGAILFTPRAPSEELNGYVLGRVGNYNRRASSLAWAVPSWATSSCSASLARCCVAMAIPKMSRPATRWTTSTAKPGAPA